MLQTVCYWEENKCKQSVQPKLGLLMGDDIGSGLSSMAICLDFRSVIGTRTSTGFDVITH